MSDILSIEAQIERMKVCWPDFILIGKKDRIAAWRGRVRPLLQRYVIEVAYRAPLAIETLDARRLQPRVSILSPALRPRPGDPEGRLPHVYYDPDGGVTLCLLDPMANDWTPLDFVAETTIPWAIEWLAAYEGWRATGVWTASGRHVEPTDV